MRSTTLNGRFVGTKSPRAVRSPRVDRPTHRRAVEDPVALLREDHAALEALFCEFENGPRHDAVRRSIVDRILESLTRHVEVEEDTIYPWAQTVLPDRDADHLASLEEHRLMVALIEDLRTLAPDHERFDARGRVLIELTRHHMWEEEASMFQDAVDAVDDDAQHDLARAVRRAHRRTG